MLALRCAPESDGPTARCRFPTRSFGVKVSVDAWPSASLEARSMQYLLLIYTEEVDPASIPSADQAAELDAYRAFTQEVTERGYMRGGDALEPTSTATTVRVREGRTLISDGPFAETKEALGGYYLVDCPDLDTALELAAKLPAAASGSIEIRPVWELPMSAMAAAAATDAAG
jgi:hypothetical protein